MSFRPNKKYRNKETVEQVLAEMKYLERIGRNPYNSSMPLPKPRKYWDTLYKRKKVKDCLGRRISKAPF